MSAPVGFARRQGDKGRGLQVIGQLEAAASFEVFADDPTDFVEVHLGEFREQAPAAGGVEVVPEPQDVFLAGVGDLSANGRLVGRPGAFVGGCRHRIPFPSQDLWNRHAEA